MTIEPGATASFPRVPGGRPMPLEPGQVVDGFRLKERLHMGGMAGIWLVERRPASPS